MPIAWNEISHKSNGGTELITRRLEEAIPESILEKVQIIPSRVRDLDMTKHRVLFCHDLPDDPESKHLENGGWKKFHRIVFVSHWQRQAYIRRFSIPWSKTAVVLNAVPYTSCDVDKKLKNQTPLNFVYTSTPQRGLGILVPVFKRLADEDKDIHLHVFSSFKIYGWDDRDQQFEPLYKEIREHNQMTHYGSIPNGEVREALHDMHIFAYPSVWPETSCMSLMEAMMAGCLCVHPDYAALPETAANLTMMYSWQETPEKHAEVFYRMLRQAMNFVRNGGETVLQHLRFQHMYAGMKYDWDSRKMEWTYLLQNVLDEPLELKTGPEFVYSTT